MTPTTSLSSAAAISLVANEVLRASERAAVSSATQLDMLVDALTSADRIFVAGAGRSGLALRMGAMRLMHLGLDVHVVGETTTPAIGDGDTLLVASGSGTTETIVRLAQKASAVGASVTAITATSNSALAEIANIHVLIPAAQKLDRTSTASDQYAGSLFEQVLVVVCDGVFHTLWQRQGTSADELWPRHANLE